jgi:RNA polymerase sigma factor for flagellar operon FliA
MTPQIDTNPGPNDLYLTHRPAIERAIRAVCRRHRMLTQDAEDFASEARMRLIQDNCAVLRRFERRSSISTYIRTVVTHLAQDWRNAHWGKWRPSAEARRQGPIAIELQRLMQRDGLTFEEACQTLRMNFRVTQSRDDLRAMVCESRQACRRRFVTDKLLENCATTDPAPDDLADWRAAADAADYAVAHLAQAIAALAPTDALLIRLRFDEGRRIVEIARALGMEAKPLYRRLERLLAQIKSELEMRGVGAAAVRDLLIRQAFAEQSERTIHHDAGAPLAWRARSDDRRTTESGSSPP